MLVYIMLLYAADNAIIATCACLLTAQICTPNSLPGCGQHAKAPLQFKSFAHCAQVFAQSMLSVKNGCAACLVYIINSSCFCGIVQLSSPFSVDCRCFDSAVFPREKNFCNFAKNY